MKKKILVIVGVFLVLVVGIVLWFVFSNKSEEINEGSDAVRFASEYKQVDKNNIFVYKNVDETLKIMKNGTGVVYLGYPECPWCQAYVKYLNEVAKEVGLEKIYYTNTKEVKENDMDKYYALIDILDENLQYNAEGEKWIYVPNVSFHISGNIIGNDYETSKDTHGLSDPSEYWTDEEVKELKNTLTNYMKEVKASLDICTDCNK